MKTNHLLLLLLTLGLAANVAAAPPQIPLTVTIEGDGTVMRVPAGTECPADCTATYKKGTTVTLTATADLGSSFLGWSGACAGNELICEIRMSAPANVVARFVTEATPQAFPATGQTSCSYFDSTQQQYARDPDCTNPESAGQDGDIQAGAALSYTDNGDGTIADDNTGLVWIKQDDNNTLDPLTCNSYPGNLDKDCRFAWGGDVFAFIDNLNANNHAGYTDWRAPNVKELQSIVNYENVNPAVSVEFNDGCVSGCVVTDCSCTSTYPPTGGAVYWSSTYIVDNSNSAWCVDFVRGVVRNLTNDERHQVRAVRGGL